jgi:hypothetical protein
MHARARSATRKAAGRRSQTIAVPSASWAETFPSVTSGPTSGPTSGLSSGVSSPMTTAWTVKDSNGRLLAAFLAGTRLEVARKVVAKPCDAFRLEVSASYRELFERALNRVLGREGWQIVAIRMKPRRTAARAISDPPTLHANS